MKNKQKKRTNLIGNGKTVVEKERKRPETPFLLLPNSAKLIPIDLMSNLTMDQKKKPQKCERKSTKNETWKHEKNKRT